MKSFFSKKLYWEGIKKIKVVGIAFSAISAILCALVPFVSMIDWYSYSNQYTESIGALDFSLPALFIIMPAAIILVLSMFSFLNKRSESDFYHAIPYKRSCVYISFMAACLSWLVFAAVLSTILAAFFWWIHPGAAVGFSIPFLNLGICILLGFTLAATTVLAMTLTGTFISNLLILCLLLCFIPVVGFLFITLLGEVVPLLHVPLTPLRFLQPEFSLPLAVLEALTMYEEQIVFNNAPMIIYTIIVTLLQLVAGCLFYMFRKSEMASKSAPNNVLQHIYRCAVSLPFALLAIMMYWMDGEFTLFIVLAVITLLIYFMYELITTKRFKNLLKATPFLGVLVAGCLVFVGGAQLTKAITLTYTPDADDIQSIGQISDYEMMYYGTSTYEDIQTDKIEIDSEEARKLISECLADSVEHSKNDTFFQYDSRDYLYDPENEPTFRTVKITDKSGKVCGRYIRLTRSQDSRLDELFLESPDYSEALLKMPSEQEIQSVYSYGNGYGIGLDDKDTKELWKSLLNEYNALSKEEKLAYKSGMTNGDMMYETQQIVVKDETESSTELPYIDPSLCYIEVWGTVGSQTFNSSYALRTDLFPKTTALYAKTFNETVVDYGDPYYTSTYGFEGARETLSLLESENMNYFSLNFGNFYYFYYDKYDNMASGLNAEQIARLKEIAEFALDHNAPAEDADYYFTLRVDLALDDYSSSYDNETLIAMTEADLQTLYRMLVEFYDK